MLNPFNRAWDIINQCSSITCCTSKLILRLSYSDFIIRIINMAANRVQSLISLDTPFVQTSHKALDMWALILAMPLESINQRAE